MTETIALTVDRSDDNTLTTIAIVGPLTLAARDRFKSFVLEELVESKARTPAPMRFRFTFTHCREADLAGLNALFASVKRIREAGGVVHAAGLSEDLVALFRATKLDELITVEAAP